MEDKKPSEDVVCNELAEVKRLMDEKSRIDVLIAHRLSVIDRVVSGAATPLGPGWIKRQSEFAAAATAKWPEWMQREAGIVPQSSVTVPKQDTPICKQRLDDHDRWHRQLGQECDK